MRWNSYVCPMMFCPVGYKTSLFLDSSLFLFDLRISLRLEDLNVGQKLFRFIKRVIVARVEVVLCIREVPPGSIYSHH
jgi:hypothetical protein